MTEKRRLHAGDLQDLIEQSLNLLLEKDYEFLESDLLGALHAIIIRSEATLIRTFNEERDIYEATHGKFTPRKPEPRSDLPNIFDKE